MQLILLKTFHQLSVIFNGDLYYDFANVQISNHVLNKHCGLLHILLIIFLFSYASYGKIVYTYKFMTPPLLTFDFVTMCLLTLLNLTIIFSSRGFFAKKMQTIMKSLENIDKNLKDFNDNTCKTTTTYIIFFVVILCLVTLIYDCAVWIVVLKDDFHYHLFRNLQYFLVFIKLLFLHQFMEEVSRKVRHVKEYIIHVIDDYALEPIENKKEDDNGEYTITGWTKSVLEKAFKEENSKIKSVTRNFNEGLAAWKKTLGAVTFVMIFFHVLFVMEFLQMTCYILAYFFGNISGTVMGNSLFIAVRVLWSFCLLVWLVTFSSTCSEISQAVSELLTNCYKFLLNVNVNGIYAIEHNLFHEFFVLFDLIAQQIDGLDNFGAFDLNRGHIFGLIIGITSFTAVLVQFNSI